MWGRALAPKVSSITNTQFQRCRATPTDSTKCKEKSWIISKETETRHKYQPDLTSVHLALNGCGALPQNGLLKHGAGKAAADRCQAEMQKRTNVKTKLFLMFPQVNFEPNFTLFVVKVSYVAVFALFGVIL